MARREIIVIGGSAGALQPLKVLIGGLPRDLPAAVFVVLHTAPESQGYLATILGHAGRLPVRLAEDGEPFQPGQVYVAPPDRHLLVKRGSMKTAKGPRENGFRPAVDPLFRTAAQAYGPQVIGIVLSGALDDGTHGLKVIQRNSGITIVQSPDEAEVRDMPQSAIAHMSVDYVAAAGEMPELIQKLLSEAVEAAPMSGMSPDIAEFEAGNFRLDQISTPASKFTCPECGGALWEFEEDNLLRFRCHVGHGFTADGLVQQHSQSLEAALWTALRTLEESAALHRRMAARARQGSVPEIARRYQTIAEDAETRAAVVRRTLFGDAGAVETAAS